MNSIDELWRSLIEEECARWEARPSSELKNLPPCTEHKTSSGMDEIKYVLWHENPEKWPNLKSHSFVLQANRKSTLLFYKNYLAGFALDENGIVIPIADDVMTRYD